MTINEYLANPYGKGSAFSNVTTQRANLDKQYQELQAKITFRTYLYRNTAIWHVIVPSQKNPLASYDVIIEVPFKENTKEDVQLADTDFKAFSNCPSFIFTYAHVFRGKGMMCNWLLDKYDMNVRKKPPARSNPYGIVGYERSLYLALRYLKTTGRTIGTVVRSNPIKPSSHGEIAKMVRTQDQIMQYSKSKLPKDEPPKTVSPTVVTRVNKKQSKPENGTIKSASTSKTTKTSTLKGSSKTTKTKKTKKV